MDKYGLILLIAMPIFVVLIIIEQVIYRAKGRAYNEIDAFSSLYSGMTNTLKDVIGLTLIIFSYPVLYDSLALVHWGKITWFTYVLAFVIMDIGGYWNHRLTHRVNYFWNLHIIHHSSEEYNLPCALRQQFAVLTNFLGLLTHGIWMALLGIPSEVYMLVAPIHLFMQFWYHTRLIGKMGVLEYILVTPSHHRVHHAMNEIYLDKNYSQIFIVWDKLFGTYQEELDSEPPVYGVRRPVQTWNPFLINFRHLWLILKDSLQTRRLSDKVKVWFMPTGWRPADVEQSHPVFYVKDVRHFEKFQPDYSKRFVRWNYIQVSGNFMLMSFLFFNIGQLKGNHQYLYYGFFLLYSIFSFTSLMDKKFYGMVLECVKVLIAAFIVYRRGDWFGLDQFWATGSVFVLAYFALGAFAAVYFYFWEFRKNERVSVSGAAV
jgi:alkylglycerol monooxygenase